MTTRISAPLNEGVGLILPKRDPAHEEIEWYPLDLDDAIEDPDAEPNDPLPTERHRTVPE